MVSVLAGYHPALIFTGLFLLGLGWSCGLIGGSTLLTESVPMHDRVAVQGAADLLMGVCGALGAVISGLVKAQLGFHMLANGATIAAVVLLVTATAPAGRWPRRRPGSRGSPRRVTRDGRRRQERLPTRLPEVRRGPTRSGRPVAQIPPDDSPAKVRRGATSGHLLEAGTCAPSSCTPTVVPRS